MVGVYRPPRDYASPADNAAAVTPSDATVLHRTRALYVGSAGDVRVLMAGDGDEITFASVPAGFILPVSVRKVYATGTTAADLVALF